MITISEDWRSLKRWAIEKKKKIILDAISAIHDNFEQHPPTLNYKQQSSSTRQAEADQLWQQGLKQYQTSQFQAALQSLEQALVIYREIGDRAGEGKALVGTGTVHDSLGQYPQALEQLQQALVIFREAGNHSGKGTILNNIGTVYRNLGQYPQALEQLQQALVISREVGDRVGEGAILNNIGEVYCNLRQYPLTMNYYQQALLIRQKVGDRAGEGATLNNMGVVCINLGQYPQALDYFQQVLLTAREIGDRAGEGTILNNIGEVYRNLGQYSSALEYNQQALSIAQAVGDRVGEGRDLNNIGLVYTSLGQHSPALNYFQQALFIVQEVGSRAMEGTTLNNIGEVYRNLGQYSLALEYYQQALSIFQEVGDCATEGGTLNNIGLVYTHLGQYLQAKEQFQQALAILKGIGDRAGEGTTLNNIGAVYAELGQYLQAKEQYQQALAILREIGDRAREGATLNNIGFVYYKLGQYPQAKEQYQQALVITREIGDRAREGTILNNIGGVYLNLGQYRQGLEHFQQALVILEEVGDRAGKSNILVNLSYILFVSGNVEAAAKMLFDAVEVLESLRSSDLSDAHKVSLFDTQIGAYVFLQQALIAQNQSEAALEVSERGRARSFVDLLFFRVSPEVTNLAVAAPTINQIRQIAHEQNATLVQYSIVYALSHIERQAVLQPSYLYIWVIKPTGEITFRSLDLTTLDTSLSTLISLSREAIGIRDRGYSIPVKPILQRPEQAKLQLQKLYQILIAPIADLLPSDSFDRIIFIPQGELFLVPFAALQDPDGSYLIQTHTILTAPSIQILDLTHQLQRDRAIDFSKALIVGNPTMPDLPTLLQPLSALPRAEQEAIAIAQQLQVQPLIGDAATETAVVQRMANASVIHLATHGLLEYGNPQASGVRDLPGAIVLARSDQDDGLLTSSKIFDLKLHASLVVLSACETGRGDITGDGVIGLSRALISAGASSVVVSLWKVADHSTEALMTEFYRQLQQHTDKAQALRQAMLKTMAEYPDPIDWAAFTLIGETEN